MDVDETLRRAAQQLNTSLAEERIPEVPRRSQRGWLVAALGAVVTIAVVGGLALVMRNESPAPLGSDIVSSTTSTTLATAPNTEPSSTDDDVRFVNEKHGFEITYPADWYRADQILAPALTSPPQQIEEVLSLGTYPLRPGGSKCPHVPLNALLDLGPVDALISIVLGTGTGNPWPAAFGPDSFLPGEIAGDAPVDARTCSGRADLDYRWGVYSLDGRSVQIFVAFGDSVGVKTQTQTWRVLDSLSWTNPPGESSEPIVTVLPAEQTLPLRVLAIRPNNPSLAVLDFETGTTTLYPPGAHALPLDATDGAVITPNRAFIIWTNGVARLFTGSLASVDVELGPHPPRDISGFAPALRVVPSPDSNRAWLVQPGLGYGPDRVPTLVELIELPGGGRRELFEADANAFPVAATATGLVLNTERLFDTGDGFTTEPGSERVIHLREVGTIDDVGEGRAVAASAAIVVRLVCPSDQPSCDIYRSNELVISNPDGTSERVVSAPIPGTWRAVGGPPIPSDAMPLQTVSPDGSTALVSVGQELDVNGTPTSSALVAVNLDDGSTRIVAEFNGATPSATWSADNQWIALFDRNAIHLINAANPETTITFTDVIPPDHFPLAAG